MPLLLGSRDARPHELHSLKQAVFVLRNLEKGVPKEQLVQLFRGDEWAVDFWMYFLLDNGLMHIDSKDNWIVTRQGEKWVEKCELSS